MTATITVRAFVEPDARCHHLADSYAAALEERLVVIEARFEIDDWTVFTLRGESEGDLITIAGDAARGLHPRLEIALPRNPAAFSR